MKVSIIGLLHLKLNLMLSNIIIGQSSYNPFLFLYIKLKMDNSPISKDKLSFLNSLLDRELENLRNDSKS